MLEKSRYPADKKWKLFHLSSSNDAGDVIMVHPHKTPKIVEIKSIDVMHTKPPAYYYSSKPYQHQRLLQLNKTITCYYFVYFIHGTNWRWTRIQANMPKVFKQDDGLSLQDFLTKECGIRF